MGARVKVIEAAPAPFRVRWNRQRSTEQPPQIVIDIRRDKAGEFFEIRTAPGSRLLTMMKRDAAVYVRGEVRHPEDHHS
jgi:hypothetical protein